MKKQFPIISFEHVSFQYEGQTRENLKDINLTIKSGEFLVITGQSGCGKTTLTRCINNLIPRFFEGTLSGEVIVSGRSIKESDAGEAGKEIASIFQDPRSQFFTTNSSSEVAFACENYGISHEERTYFARVGTDIITHLSKLSSIGEELDAEQRLQIFRDFFRADEPQCFPFDMKAFAKKGSSFKDWICPQSMEFSKDFFKINERFGRVLYMQDYASYVKDDMISELCDLSRDLMLSIDILPVPTDEAVREIQNRLLGVETNVTNWQRRQNANNNFSAIVPYDMELQRKETKEMLDDLTTRDQRMMFGILTMVHMADSKKQLDSDTESILSVVRKHLCQMATLKWQQVDGLNTVLPYGIRKINALRTLTTESTAVLIPFHTQEIMQPGGIYYGQNAVSKNMLVADRRKLLNGNSFRLGVSGSGKSFSAKEEIVDLALSTEDDILILDPESEFGSLVEALNGEVISISATSHTHLNALDMDSAYGYDKNPLI